MSRRRLFRKRPLRRGLVRAEDGASAVEFALIALPFCFMLFAIIEVAMVFALDSVLENATMETGRLVRTGQASAQGMTAAQFKAELCRRMTVFEGDCNTRATIDVRVIPQFNTTPPDPASGSSFDSSGLGYTNGQPRSLMLVRVWYRHPLFTTFLSQGLSRMGDGTALLTATTAFRNEPPGGGAAPAATS